jgi:hypothetical protein
MLWYQHLFAVWILAHMLWAAAALEREWRRMRGHQTPTVRTRLKNVFRVP